MRSPPTSALLLVALSLGACRAPPPAPPQPRAIPSAPAGPRVVAIGDLHGDLTHALGVLQLAGVVDGEGRWAGGDTTLVQTGAQVFDTQGR